MSFDSTKMKFETTKHNVRLKVTAFEPYKNKDTHSYYVIHKVRKYISYF